MKNGLNRINRYLRGLLAFVFLIAIHSTATAMGTQGAQWYTPYGYVQDPFGFCAGLDSVGGTRVWSVDKLQYDGNGTVVGGTCGWSDSGAPWLGAFAFSKVNGSCAPGYDPYGSYQCRKQCSPGDIHVPEASDNCETPKTCGPDQNYVAEVNQCRPKAPCPTGSTMNVQTGQCEQDQNGPGNTSSSSSPSGSTPSSNGTPSGGNTGEGNGGTGAGNATTTSSGQSNQGTSPPSASNGNTGSSNTGTGNSPGTGSTTTTGNSGSSTTTSTTTTTGNSGANTSGDTVSGATSGVTHTSGDTGNTGNTGNSGNNGNTGNTGSNNGSQDNGNGTASGLPSGTPSGSPSGTPSGSPDDKSDFCTKNPTLNICKNSTVEGTCADTTCDGDAITCAILQKQRQQYCEDHDEKDPNYQYGKKLLSGDDPLRDKLPSADKASEVDVSKDVTADGWGGGGSCFSDKSFDLMGKTINIPLSKLCDYLIILRYAIMLIAGIVSYKMVSGTILRDL